MTSLEEHRRFGIRPRGYSLGVPDFSWLPKALTELEPAELVERQRNETREQLIGARERLTASYRRVRQLEEAAQQWDWFVQRVPVSAERNR